MDESESKLDGKRQWLEDVQGHRGEIPDKLKNTIHPSRVNDKWLFTRVEDSEFVIERQVKLRVFLDSRLWNSLVSVL